MSKVNENWAIIEVSCFIFTGIFLTALLTVSSIFYIENTLSDNNVRLIITLTTWAFVSSIAGIIGGMLK